MPEKTKPGEKVDQKRPPEEDKKNLPEAERENWSQDQLEKSYYYDDSHGYEIYDPNEDEEDD